MADETIHSGDIRILQSERMTDNADGGGRLTGRPVTDGASNDIFDDISDLDRAAGRTSLRKVGAGVLTDNTAQYFGAHAIIDQVPADPNVSVVMFDTGSPSDERAESRDYVESYVTAGATSRMTLLGDQLAGQRSIITFQMPEATLPDLGDVLALMTEQGDAAGEVQYVRISEIDHEIRTFEYENGSNVQTFERRVLTLGLSTALRQRVYGVQPKPGTLDPDTVIREGQSTDAARYYGVSTLTQPATFGANSVTVASTYAPLVPATTTEQAVTDVQVGGTATISVSSGGSTFEVAQIASTTQIAIELNNRGFTYVSRLDPLPAPGSVVIAYRSLGKWYELRDSDANGDLSGSGAGRVDYATGSVSVTLGGLPDVGSSVLFSWGTPAHYEDRAGQATIDKPWMTFVLDHAGVMPGSVTVRWISGGSEKSATDDGLGSLSGAATGRVVYGYADGSGAPQPGEAYVEFNGDAFPDASTQVEIEYDYGAPKTEQFLPSANGAGLVSLSISDAPVRPGSVAITWSVVRTWSSSESESRSSPRTGTWETVEQNGGEADVTYTITDDGRGGFNGGWEGSIDYATGAVTFEVEKIREVSEWDDGDATHREWGSKEKRDVFENGSSVWLTSQLDSAAPTTHTITQDLAPLDVELMPLLQDSVVPGTLSFIFRGDTFIDRQGSLYRSVTSNGAGVLAGTIDYGTGDARITDWPSGTSATITVKTLVSTFGTWTLDEAFFRTPGSPLQVGGLLIQATTLDGRSITGQAALSGEIEGDEMAGSASFETGVVRVTFGKLVSNDSLSAAERAESWYDATAVDDAGMIWRPTQVIPSTARFNAVILTTLPLEAELIGIDPVRLPSDGRVPIYRAGGVVVVHHTGRAPFPLGIGGGTTLDVGRSRLASLVVEDATGEEVPATQYSADLDAGTVQLAAPDTATHPEPWYALHRVEDMLLVGDVDLSGALTLKGNLSHDYPAGDTLVSAAMVAGDLQARVADFFDLSSWDRDWSKDDNDGADGTLAEYNVTTYPPIITNRGAITEDWALIFTSSSTFRIIGRTVGEIGVGNINEDTSPTNPNQSVPYWLLRAGGFGAGWVNGNVIRFSTIGASFPMWLARVILQGPASGQQDSFRLQIRGNANA